MIPSEKSSSSKAVADTAATEHTTPLSSMTPATPQPYAPPTLRTGGANTPLSMSSSSGLSADYSPYASGQQRREEFAKRETEQKFSFIFFSPDESLSMSDADTDFENLTASIASMNNPDFVDAARASLRALEHALPPLPQAAEASGSAAPQHAAATQARRQALIAACLQTMQQYLGALLDPMPKQAAAKPAPAALPAASGSATPGRGATVATDAAASSASSTALPSTPPVSPWQAPRKMPDPLPSEQRLLFKVGMEVPGIITDHFGPLLKELQSATSQAGRHNRHGDEARKEALSAFTFISTHLMQAKRFASAMDVVNCREALQLAASRLEEFRSRYLPSLLVFLPDGGSPLPGKAERKLKEALRNLASCIDALIEQPRATPHETGRERANSNPLSPQKPNIAGTAPPGSPRSSPTALAAARIRFLSANARTPRKLVREAASIKRSNDAAASASSTPVPRTTTDARGPGLASTAPAPQSTAEPAVHGAIHAPAQSTRAPSAPNNGRPAQQGSVPQSPRGAQRKEDS